VLNRSVVRSTADQNHRNKQVTSKLDLQDRMNSLDVNPSPITRNNHHKQKIRGPSVDVSN
jgi:hypothetical protein